MNLPICRHDARHTHATVLLKGNVSPKVVSERLGHASVSLTLDVYSHVIPGIQAAAAAHFDEMLGRTLRLAKKMLTLVSKMLAKPKKIRPLNQPGALFCA